MRNPFAVVIPVLCASLLLPTTGYTLEISAQALEPKPQHSVAKTQGGDSDDVSVIVKLQYDSIASYKGGVDGLDACSIAVTGGSRLDPTTPACLAYRAFLESKVEALEQALELLDPKDRAPLADRLRRLEHLPGRRPGR